MRRISVVKIRWWWISIVLFFCLNCVLLLAKGSSHDWSPPDDCVANKTFHFLGNSITRSWAFMLYDVIAKSPGVRDRSVEKQLCKSGATAEEGENCELTVKNTTINFSWAQSIYSNAVEDAMLEPADYIMLNVGAHYVFSRADHRLFRTQSEVILLRDVLEEHPEICEKFWYRTSTRVCGKCNGCDAVEVQNARIYEENLMIMNELDGLPIHFFNAWTNASVCTLYDDHVHSHRLAYLHLVQWLQRDICRTITFHNNNTTISPMR
jgi:hypothetical protein